MAFISPPFCLKATREALFCNNILNQLRAPKRSRIYSMKDQTSDLESCENTSWLNRPFPNYLWPLFQSESWPGLLEAWLALTSVKCHGNLLGFNTSPLNQRIALTRLRTTGPWCSSLLMKISFHLHVNEN